MEKKFRKIKNFLNLTLNTVRNDGLNFYFYNILISIIKRDFNFVNLILRSRRLYFNELIKSQLILDKVSIIIPTNSTIHEVNLVLDAIKKQKGLQDFEIILINSGYHDLSLLNNSTIKVITINPADFQHGRTRNLGIDSSHGKYLIFTTDDAIPSSDWVFFKMVKVLQSDSRVAAVTGKQFQKKDSNIFYTINMHAHYKRLGLTFDRVMWSNDFEKLTQLEKSNVSQIDDVCSCYRQEMFLKNKFSEVEYIEDLEMGIRLAKKGMKIAQLCTEGVFHSHNRPSSYFLKRNYAGIVTHLNLFGKKDFTVSFPNVDSLNDFSLQIIPLYRSLCFAIDDLKESNLSSYNIEDGLKTIKEKIKTFYSQQSNPKNTDKSLDELFYKIFQTSNVFPVGNYDENILAEPYFDTLLRLQESIQEVYPNLRTMNCEILETLINQFAQLVGYYLGYLFYFKKLKDEKELKHIHKILMAGI